MLAGNEGEAAGAAGLVVLLVWAAFGIVSLGIYFLPAIVAVVRKAPNTVPVVIINVFLGWTLIGWVVALAMAFATRQQPTPIAYYYGHPPAGAWHPDPTGRYKSRWWDGTVWTEHVLTHDDTPGIDRIA